MALSSDRSGMNSPFGTNVTSIDADDGFVKATTGEIIEMLKFDDDEMGGQIVEDLLTNGRQALVGYKVDIIPKIYNEVMNGNDTKLMSSLKKYFQHQWEIQYGSSNPWFISFLKQYDSGENHDIYESILIRTAEYGNKYMKDYPLLSVVLQLLFESIDDYCLQKTDVFDSLWMTITNDGLKSIKEYSDYISKKVLNEQLQSQSALFQALREYYRPNVFLSLTQSPIVNNQNLRDLALDDVVEHGWLSDMKSVEDDMTPRRYQMLLEYLRSFYKKHKPSPNEGPNDPVVSSLEISSRLAPKQDTGGSEKSESSAKVNQSEINQLQLPVSTRNITSMEEILSDTKSVTKVLDHVTDKNIETTESQKDENEQSGDESHDLSDSNSGLGNPDMLYSKDTVFISGLPTTMSKAILFHKLRAVFTTCGEIQIYEKTNQSDIWLIPRRENRLQLNGTAILKFEKKESAMVAIGKYNGQQIPALNNARISVRFYRMKPSGGETSSSSTLTAEARSSAQRPALKGPGTIHTKGTQQKKRDVSLSSNSSINSASGYGVPDTRTMPTYRKGTIYIIGLPTNISEQQLFDTLWDEFSNVGVIKIDIETKKPCIYLFKSKDPKPELIGRATLTFENEVSVIKAIENYNGKQVPSLNDRQIYVQRSEMKTAGTTKSLMPQPRLLGPEKGQPDAPVSIFWDIENVAIPSGNSAFNVVMKLRKRLIEDRKLVEDTFKTYHRNVNSIPQSNRIDLEHANVFTQLIVSNKTGAVDLQIHKDLQQFIEQHKTSATVVLISGDIDFIGDISNLRFRHKHYTIVIHNPQVNQKLLKTANEFISWEEFVEKKCYDNKGPRYPTKVPKIPLNEVRRPPESSIRKPQHNLERNSSPTHSFDKTRTSTMPPECPPLIDLNWDNSTVHLESNSTVADRPNPENPYDYSKNSDDLKNEEHRRKRRHMKENKQLMPLASDPSNAPVASECLVISSTNKSKKPQNKTKPVKTVNIIPCSMCDKEFTSDTALIQHETDKHKVGTLVDVFSLATTADSNDHNNPTLIDLITFANDEDGDLPQATLPTATTEISHLVAVSDDDGNTSESSSELNGSILLERNSSDNEKQIEVDIAKHPDND